MKDSGMLSLELIIAAENKHNEKKMLIARARMMTNENRIICRLRFEPVGDVRTESRDVDWMCYQYKCL